MGNMVLTLLIVVIILVVVFLILREVNCWYWKINERILLQQKTNFLLTKILMQLGASDPDEIIIEEIEIEEIETGKRKTIRRKTWLDYKMKNPNSKKYKIVEQDASPEKVAKPKKDAELKYRLYQTNQGEIYIKHAGEELKVGDLVFNYFKRPLHDSKFKIKNGAKITVEGGKIVEIEL